MEEKDKLIKQLADDYNEAIAEIRFNMSMSTIGLKENSVKRVVKARDLAIKALEKQIPKKPTTIDYEKYMDTVKNALFLKGAYWCPNCKHVVKCGTYCSDCGQKLDWSDEE